MYLVGNRGGREQIKHKKESLELYTWAGFEDFDNAIHNLLLDMGVSGHKNHLSKETGMVLFFHSVGKI